MRDRSIKYIASIFLLVSVCYVNPLAAQEDGFMFLEGGGDSYQEKPEAPSSPGTENTYTQPGMKSSYPKDKQKPEEKVEESNKQKSTNTSSNNHSQTQNKQQTTSPSTSGANSEDEDPDSVLSFNFLHYIIQRFKFSEVIDE